MMIAVTSVPSPGVSLTDWVSLAGYVVKRFCTPLSVAGTSGFGPAKSTWVGHGARVLPALATSVLPALSLQATRAGPVVPTRAASPVSLRKDLRLALRTVVPRFERGW